MAKMTSKTAADFIAPLNINGLSGRMLHAPATTKKNRPILVVYDQHSSLERWWPLIQELRRYGTVTMPDLPGFGGMHSFHRINRKPSIDALASYLATFVKLRYKRKTVTIVAIGTGFVVTTRMLQQYPDLHKKVDLLVAIDGFAHYKDLKLNKKQRMKSNAVARIFGMRGLAQFFRNIFLHPGVLKASSKSRLPIGRLRYEPLTDKVDNRSEAISNNTRLWRKNDVRTLMHLNREILMLDNCTKQINLPLWHLTSKSSDQLDRFRADQHLKVIYDKVVHVPSTVPNYSTVGIISYQKKARLLPPKLKTRLNRV